MHTRLLLVACLVAFVLATTITANADGPQTVGLQRNDPGAFEGYTMFSPNDGNAYLIDNEGRLVHFWDSEDAPGLTPYLLEDGSIIRIGRGDHAGHVLQQDWDGNLIWDFDYKDADHLAHHDLEPLPNGNVLVISREYMTGADAIAQGRDPESVLEMFWPDKIIEVQRTGPTTGEIVWEWRVWDHLVQDFDSAKPNYGVVADHPELVDINHRVEFSHPQDWLHPNAVDYNAELDQIVFSVRHFNELWVIDHSTTTEEAASHSGGNSGRGGDLLYRWGNPAAYGRGDESDQQLFLQHDTQWIEPGLPGAGNLLVFNNGHHRPGGDYSSVDEIVPPLNADGSYDLALGEAYGPAAPVWSYSNGREFFSDLISGTRRLPNGNTLVDSGAQGVFFEVTQDGEEVWRYINPVTREGPLQQSSFVPRGDALYVFRIYRYGPDYPGLQGRDLTPMGPIELPKATATETPEVTPTATPTRTPIWTPTSTPTPAEPVGDVNGDGEVTSSDAEIVLSAEVGLTPVDEAIAGDVNDDGAVDAKDAMLILQVSAGLLEELPAASG